jgi:hypothetical protein
LIPILQKALKGILHYEYTILARKYTTNSYLIEDRYIVARALADFIPEEEGRFIALEVHKY